MTDWKNFHQKMQNQTPQLAKQSYNGKGAVHKVLSSIRERICNILEMETLWSPFDVFDVSISHLLHWLRVGGRENKQLRRFRRRRLRLGPWNDGIVWARLNDSVGVGTSNTCLMLASIKLPLLRTTYRRSWHWYAHGVLLAMEWARLERSNQHFRKESWGWVAEPWC